MREKILLCDGSFGTYFESKHPDFGGAVECANLEGAGLVRAVHAEYLESGARMLRTNTFGANEPALRCGREGVNGILRAGYAAARALADERPDGPVFVATSIGPVFSDGADLEYRLIAREFLDAGAEVVLFETLSEYDAVLPLLKELKATGARGGRGPFVILSFCVNRYGYTDTGISAKRIVQTLSDVDEVDCIGFNCGTGPLHLYRVLSALDLAVPKFLMVLPNAGYPEIANNRFSYQQNIPYFTEWVARIRELGVNIIGGCCGTTPQYTRMLREKIPESPVARAKKRRAAATASQSNSAPAAQTRGPASPSPSPFFGEKLRARQKILAVELDPPLNANYTKLMEDAIRLKNQGVDILTFADSPTGRARADSFLIASKVVNETGVRVMPHICCRDKNEIAVRSQILGAHINGIRDVLAVTGDPIPKASRGSVRGVFSFDSVRLMRLIAAMNGELFAKDPIRFGGAVNYTRANLDVEADRILRKAEAGASFFLTQPVYGERDVETILWLKRRTGAVILVGLMPLIGLRNAVFVKNELPGIRVPDALVERYERESGGDGDGGDGNAAAAAGGGNSAAAGGAGREAGERIGVEAARDVIRATAAEADGYYFILPFNRVHLVPRILEGGLL